MKAFVRYVLFGGGAGVLSGIAVAALADHLPWALANALVAVVSTALTTELHARFTFGPGTGARATGRQHAQAAASATAAYAATCAAMLLLHLAVDSPGTLVEQAVYLGASALAGLARFAVLRVLVFTRTDPHTAAATPAGPAPIPRQPPSGAARITRTASDTEATVASGTTPAGRCSEALRPGSQTVLNPTARPPAMSADRRSPTIQPPRSSSAPHRSAAIRKIPAPGLRTPTSSETHQASTDSASPVALILAS